MLLQKSDKYQYKFIQPTFRISGSRIRIWSKGGKQIYLKVYKK